jgi:hypothetical protein
VREGLFRVWPIFTRIRAVNLGKDRLQIAISVSLQQIGLQLMGVYPSTVRHLLSVLVPVLFSPIPKTFGRSVMSATPRLLLLNLVSSGVLEDTMLIFTSDNGSQDIGRTVSGSVC